VVAAQPNVLYNRIADEIRTALLEGRLKPGDRLPPERELCRQLGVSRTSLREAMKVLAGNGLVTSRQGGGTFIADGDPHWLAEGLARTVLLDQTALGDLFELRRTLETEAASWAATRATPEQLAALATLLHACAARAEAGTLATGDYMDYDQRFHALVAGASGNALLVRLMSQLIDVLRLSRDRSLRVPGRADQSVREHLAILAALEQRDPAAARQRMLDHITSVEQSIGIGT
jgi:GntR family transcriptional regulator, transcriptional repressor for pyruvate dehydrogenase complex